MLMGLVRWNVVNRENGSPVYSVSSEPLWQGRESHRQPFARCNGLAPQACALSYQRREFAI
jgi:hypothetical protein